MKLLFLLVGIGLLSLVVSKKAPARNQPVKCPVKCECNDFVMVIECTPGYTNDDWKNLKCNFVPKSKKPQWKPCDSKEDNFDYSVKSAEVKRTEPRVLIHTPTKSAEVKRSEHRVQDTVLAPIPQPPIELTSTQIPPLPDPRPLTQPATVPPLPAPPTRQTVPYHSIEDLIPKFDPLDLDYHDRRTTIPYVAVAHISYSGLEIAIPVGTACGVLVVLILLTLVGFLIYRHKHRQAVNNRNHRQRNDGRYVGMFNESGRARLSLAERLRRRFYGKVPDRDNTLPIVVYQSTTTPASQGGGSVHVVSGSRHLRAGPTMQHDSDPNAVSMTELARKATANSDCGEQGCTITGRHTHGGKRRICPHQDCQQVKAHRHGDSYENFDPRPQAIDAVLQRPICPYPACKLTKCHNHGASPIYQPRPAVIEAERVAVAKTASAIHLASPSQRVQSISKVATSQRSLSQATLTPAAKSFGKSQLDPRYSSTPRNDGLEQALKRSQQLRRQSLPYQQARKPLPAVPPTPDPDKLNQAERRLSLMKQRRIERERASLGPVDPSLEHVDPLPASVTYADIDDGRSSPVSPTISFSPRNLPPPKKPFRRLGITTAARALVAKRNVLDIEAADALDESGRQPILLQSLNESSIAVINETTNETINNDTANVTVVPVEVHAEKANADGEEKGKVEDVDKESENDPTEDGGESDNNETGLMNFDNTIQIGPTDPVDAQSPTIYANAPIQPNRLLDGTLDNFRAAFGEDVREPPIDVQSVGGGGELADGGGGANKAAKPIVPAKKQNRRSSVTAGINENAIIEHKRERKQSLKAKLAAQQ